MRYFLLSLGIIAVLSNPSAVAAEDWKELKGDHFIIYHQAGEDRFSTDALRKAEEYYRKISSDLGYQRYSDFWQWDKRVKIYIYPNQSEFIQATGQQDWSHGVADYTHKTISSFTMSEDFLDSLLPHEITHLIFRDYVGFKGEIPLWLDEGVAQWEEPATRKKINPTMKYLFQQGKLLPIETLTSLDIRKVSDQNLVDVFYVQAVSTVQFLVEKHGTDGFVTFCRQLRDGKSLAEALRFSYPTSITSLNELEQAWKKYIVESPNK